MPDRDGQTGPQATGIAVRDSQFHFEGGEIDDRQQRLITAHRVLVFNEEVADDSGDRADDRRLRNLTLQLGDAKPLLPDVELGGLQFECKTFRLQLRVLLCVPETQLGKCDVVVCLVVVELADGFLGMCRHRAALFPPGRDPGDFGKVRNLVILQLDLACLDLLALEGRLRGFQRSLLLFEQVEQFRAVDRGNEIALLNRVPRLDGEIDDPGCRAEQGWLDCRDDSALSGDVAGQIASRRSWPRSMVTSALAQRCQTGTTTIDAAIATAAVPTSA